MGRRAPCSRRVLIGVPLAVGCQTNITWTGNAMVHLDRDARLSPCHDGNLGVAPSRSLLVSASPPQSEAWLRPGPTPGSRQAEHPGSPQSQQLRELCSGRNASFSASGHAQRLEVLNASAAELTQLCHEVSLELAHQSIGKLEELSALAGSIALELGPDAARKARRIKDACLQLSHDLTAELSHRSVSDRASCFAPSMKGGLSYNHDLEYMEYGRQ